MSIQSLCIFCGSKKGRLPIYADTAADIGRSMASKGIRLVYGGGSVGLMGVLADACLEAGGEVIGVITEQLMDLELGHSDLTELCVVDTMLDRKALMADRADAFISIPGSVGTLDELFEMLTWTQLNIHFKPSGLLNINGYYDNLIALIDNLVKEEFLSQPHADQLHVETNFDTLLARLESMATG
ncbi:MAG: TIGR00730 family Rossman fold protein [Verrucomicrobia bacterium]|nr:TIGR00730 family Rossman fold protein [Verrucomicrobiota bacterium]